jgi:hypothetical protein
MSRFASLLNRNKNITGITNETTEYKELAHQNDTFIETEAMFTCLFEEAVDFS